MIGFLDGAVAGRTADGCFVDVGGVGYRLTCSATTLRALPADGARARLWTHVHVREDALALFGFATEAEQRAFEALISVSGVGPRVALAVCSALSPDALRRAVATDDAAALAAIPGIGKKTAARIVLELRERLGVPDLHVVGGDGDGDVASLARSALENLGYSPSEVRAALAGVELSDDLQSVVRSALVALGRGAG
ncbi:MAG TPA: Holliday junction branch migration protein RuvA [Actinomycetota bacterium]|nr:Holliday junction branch migration protein RuvA [Actinomycetota bacterium]